MWTSSTATPAASGGALSARGEARKQRSGRSRLPPAASASPATAAARPGRRAVACASRCLERRHVAREPRRGVDGELRHAARSPCGWATIEPARSRKRTSVKPTSRSARRAPRRAGTAAPRRAGTGTPPPPGKACPTSGTTRSNQSEKNGRSAPRGCVISRIASRPPGRSTRCSSRSAELEVGEVAGAEADRRRVERLIVERQREQVALRPSRPPADLRRARSSIALGEVEPGHVGRASAQVGEREVARAARGVEHAVAGRTTAAAASRRQRRSSPAVITRFIES